MKTNCLDPGNLLQTKINLKKEKKNYSQAKVGYTLVKQNPLLSESCQSHYGFN